MKSVAVQISEPAHAVGCSKETWVKVARESTAASDLREILSLARTSNELKTMAGNIRARRCLLFGASFVVSFALLPGCGRAAAGTSTVQGADDGGTAMPSSPSTSRPCGDVTGAWSPVVSGLRARLVTSGSIRDRSALDITLEIENVSADMIDLSWTGSIPLGFARFHLDDASGKDIEPAWRFGGNELTGDVRAIFRPHQTVRYRIHRGAFVTMMGKRALRIGAFWGRELPTDGSKRFLRATLTGGPPHAKAIPYAYEGDDLVRDPPSARPFSAALDVPPVCVD